HASNAQPTTPAANGPLTDSRPAEAESIPRFVDCSLLGMSGRDKLRVALPGDIGLVPGQPLRLARQRYDAVFRVPAAAVKQEGERKLVYVAAATGMAEARDV